MAWYRMFFSESAEAREVRMKQALEELAKQLGEPQTEETEQYMRRFLEHNDLDVAKAVAHVKEERAWRAQTLPITLTAKEEEVRSSNRVRFLGVNDEGFAVLVLDFMWGKFLEGFTPEETLRAFTAVAEETLAAMREAPGPGRWIFVFLGGPPPSAFTLGARQLLDTYYPARVERCIIYPLPAFLQSAFAPVLYCLPAKIRAKIIMVSSEETLRELAGLPSGGHIELPEDLRGGFEGYKQRAQAQGQELPGVKFEGVDALEARAELDRMAGS